MKKMHIFTWIILLLINLHCGKKPFHVVPVDNPVFNGNIVFIGSEDLSSLKFKNLRQRFSLDTIFHGETDELKRILLLRGWIRKVIEIDNIGPFPDSLTPERILDFALKGQGFHCSHYMAVQNAIMNAYGYVSRRVRADEGALDKLEGHHGINEVWLNSYHKWFLSDAKYDYHFEKNNIPLSALEIRDEYFKNKAADIVLVKGPDRKVTASYPELKNRTKELFARIYTWISWDKYNKVYTGSGEDSSSQVFYGDEYFRTHTWLREGEPHWAYNTRFMEVVADRNNIEWTPNTISSHINIQGSKASIALTSITPNFKTYQLKILPANEWKDVNDKVDVVLENDKNQFVFRAVNSEDVTGPEHTVFIER